MVFVASLILFFLCGNQEAVGQSDYPSKPITIYVGFAAGGQTDIAARKLAPEVAKYLGQPVVVENKPGAGGIIAAAFISKQEPDGYRFAAISNSSLIRAPHMQQVPYDPFKDITPLAQLMINVPGIIVRSDSPLKNFKDFIKLAKGSVEPVKYAHVGIGTGPHLALEALKKKYGFNLEAVPFNGDAPTNTAIQGGHLPVGASSTGGFGALVKQGELRLLVLFGDDALDFFPGVPIAREFGYDLSLDAKQILVGPPKLPPAIIQKVETAFAQAINSPGYKKLMKDMCVTAEPFRGNQELSKLLAKEYEMNGEIIRMCGLGKK
jgi:tripartite-type tricarboxylate transporter receptor subunit TctC